MDIEALAENRNYLEKQVADWLDEQAKRLRLACAGDAPMWDEYESAERALNDALRAVPEVNPPPSQ